MVERPEIAEDKPRCCEKVSGSGRYGSLYRRTCSLPVTAERDGKPYCSTHDPERVAARQTKKDEERQRERVHRDRLLDTANALATKLGMGHPNWDRGSITGIALNFDDARKLIERLAEFRLPMQTEGQEPK